VLSPPQAAPGRKGGSAHGLTKKFNWIDRVRMGWAGKTQLALLQADTERVKDVIGDNIMLELGNLESADQLDEKARELQNAGKQFQAGARQAKRNECIKDCKLKIMIGGVVLLVVRAVARLLRAACCVLRAACCVLLRAVQPRLADRRRAWVCRSSLSSSPYPEGMGYDGWEYL
jgi:hypothetical protein